MVSGTIEPSDYSANRNGSGPGEARTVLTCNAKERLMKTLCGYNAHTYYLLCNALLFTREGKWVEPTQRRSR